MEWLRNLAARTDGRLGHWRLCIGPALLRLVDYGLTLYGQPAAYWAGNFAYAEEGSPPLRWCLQGHPLLFVAMGLVLIGLASLLLLCMSRRSAQLLGVFLMCAHIYGVFSWVMPAPFLGIPVFLALLYFCVSLSETLDDDVRRAGKQTALVT